MTRTAAHDRLGRLLAIVPWVAARDGPEIAEVCRRFGITQRELLADLDLLFVCGVYPFTPDVLIDVDIADGRVWIRFADYFRRPLRLTPPEGLALIGAGAALLGVPGADPDGALARALDKLATVLGLGAEEAVAVELGPVRPETLERVQQAGGERLFRVDRISRVVVLDEHFSPPEAAPPAAVFHGGPDDEVIILDLERDARWVAEQYPNEGVVEERGGRLRVTLRVSERAWLERVLLRAGTDASMIRGDPAIRSEAAARILGRYLPAPAGSVS